MIDNKYKVFSAPLQGITDNTFRTLFSRYYGGVDEYVTPFIREEHGAIRKKDINDLHNNELENVVPQILPSGAEELDRLTQIVAECGYKRIDINLGCSFPPVAAHGRGSVLFNTPEKIREILVATNNHKDITYSVKMRLGFADSRQWRDVVDIINDAPLSRVSVHARYGRQQYKGECDLAEFGDFLSACKHKVVYNGDLCTEADIERIVAQFPDIEGVMLGRGLISDMNLARKLRGEEVADKRVFANFHNELANTYKASLCGDRPFLLRMKAFWEFWETEETRKAVKKVKKASSIAKYDAAVMEYLSQAE